LGLPGIDERRPGDKGTNTQRKQSTQRRHEDDEGTVGAFFLFEFFFFIRQEFVDILHIYLSSLASYSWAIPGCQAGENALP
jgi:hypothetical protein